MLFNGGVLKSGLIAGRVLDTLNDWLAADGAAPARLLGGADLDLAVARGAAYYGYVRRGRRCASAAAPRAPITSASSPRCPPSRHGAAARGAVRRPFGMEEGSEAALPAQEFGLVVGEPVRFRFFGSSVRRQDEVGTLLDFWQPDELQGSRRSRPPCPPRPPPGEVVRVKLHARVTETGTLELEALPVDGSARWKVQFDVRGNAEA